ncbi:Sapep family Mn(2+)-dependent dipeptidase [Christensenellaceae bacterium OttesenSCG-928-L17]|nr:Sapep family Mn(2+)-dependent dipeptidase [Christensenellaceae bacterium OttesenSCG-928-L17]
MAFYSRLTPGLEQRLTAAIDEMLPAQMASLKELIRFESVKQPPKNGMPFGEEMQRALSYTLALCETFGLQTRDLEGYVGVAEHGSGKETLGILAHLDVVPAGDGWSIGPFSGEIKDGRLYGRGALDDKGPLLSAVYALAAIIRLEIPLSHKVQLIFGCDEESGWACMDRFKRTEPMPDIAFSPDAEYPLVYSERAIVQATFRARTHGSKLSIHSGERANVVPGTAYAIVPKDIAVPASFASPGEGFTIEVLPEADGTRIAVTGFSAHASMPEKGKNALQCLLALLCELPLPCHDKLIVRTLHNAFLMDMHGETLGVDTLDHSGRLTLNIGMLHFDGEHADITVDARSPETLLPEVLLSTISSALNPAGFVLHNSRIQGGHFVPEESPLVQRLMQVYRAQTGDHESQPLAIGGGTYARAIPMAVAFGCEFPDEEALVHMPNEYIPLNDIKRNTYIMADAILALAGYAGA